MEMDDDGASAHEASPRASRNHHAGQDSRMDYAPMILAAVAGLALWGVLHFLNMFPPLIPVFP